MINDPEFENRFWAKVKRGDPSECWNWQAARCGTHNGYGQTYYKGRKLLAHRAAWMISHGYLPPEDLEICHTCDNGLCCNPDHLWLGTHRENMIDRNRKGRIIYEKGSERCNAKLTEVDIEKILQLLEQGLSQRAIAKRFNVSQPKISHIKSGQSWSHVSRKGVV